MKSRPPGFVGFLAAAVVAHEVVLACALAVAHPGTLARSLAASRAQIEILIEAPAFANPPPVEEPPPAPAPAPPTPVRDRAERAVVSAADSVAGAARILTTDQASPTAATIASGNDTGPGYGLVAGDASGALATWSRRASIGGRSGGDGQDTRPTAALGPDRSRAARVIAGYADECEFPREAREINHALVVVVVDVRKDGTAASVVVKSDPGHGFGRAARICALGRRYEPARDRDGKPTGGPTDPVTVRFLR